MVHYSELPSSGNALCELSDYKIQKSTFPYEWLGSYDKQNHIGLEQLVTKGFYSSLKDCNKRK